MNALAESYLLMLENKYKKIILNKWVWVVVGLIVFIGIGSYAFYCTSRGYNFTGSVKLHWPKFWEMGIGCKR
ncbi:hypothetical protein GYM68_05585 [Lactobacillus panisapium]|uniref:hypothetical protein n=1 Tax=Lactobacillus panisapium TaxID=2012495 RepID=UPI001C6A2414|nr:hypothetical protein [Lactobacillus panisapium]QYN58740.1 hypothetical protein GYM68_05585 [Lactobacillus panisapium]